VASCTGRDRLPRSGRLWAIRSIQVITRLPQQAARLTFRIDALQPAAQSSAPALGFFFSFSDLLGRAAEGCRTISAHVRP